MSATLRPRPNPKYRPGASSRELQASQSAWWTELEAQAERPKSLHWLPGQKGPAGITEPGFVFCPRATTPPETRQPRKICPPDT